jgi:hypothetical protein
MGVIFIIGGSVGIILAFIGKNFGTGDADAMSSFARPVSNRYGRVVCAIAGTMLLAFGIRFLLF